MAASKDGPHTRTQFQDPASHAGVNAIRIALAIVRLFDSGGLQRHCLEIAGRLRRRGHDVTIVCCSSEITPADIALIRLPNSAIRNHTRNLRFADAMARVTAGQFDVVVGFNKIPHLDVLYCADPPIPRPTTILQTFNPRIRGYQRLDLSCFGEASRTRALLLTEHQMAQFSDYYATPPERMIVLPPTLERARILAPDASARAHASVRDALGLAPTDLVWLFVGGYPRSKGLDRIIEAMPAVPAAKCLCVGFDPAEMRPSGLGRLAEHHGVADRLLLLGLRDDVPQLMAASDLLVHPSRKDVTGTVILEAIANGVPVVTTEACGYAGHVTRADAGIVITDAFDAARFTSALVAAQDADRRATWRHNARAYAAREDLVSGFDRAVEEIEKAGARRQGAVQPPG